MKCESCEDTGWLANLGETLPCHVCKPKPASECDHFFVSTYKSNKPYCFHCGVEEGLTQAPSQRNSASETTLSQKQDEFRSCMCAKYAEQIQELQAKLERTLQDINTLSIRNGETEAKLAEAEKREKEKLKLIKELEYTLDASGMARDELYSQVKELEREVEQNKKHHKMQLYRIFELRTALEKIFLAVDERSHVGKLCKEALQPNDEGMG